MFKRSFCNTGTSSSNISKAPGDIDGTLIDSQKFKSGSSIKRFHYSGDIELLNDGENISILWTHVQEHDSIMLSCFYNPHNNSINRQVLRYTRLWCTSVYWMPWTPLFAIEYSPLP